jgi:hypothetical protein
MCIQCEENGTETAGGLTDGPTDSSKAICPPFFEGGHKKVQRLFFLVLYSFTQFLNTLSRVHTLKNSSNESYW